MSDYSTRLFSIVLSHYMGKKFERLKVASKESFFYLKKSSENGLKKIFGKKCKKYFVNKSS